MDDIAAQTTAPEIPSQVSSEASPEQKPKNRYLSIAGWSFVAILAPISVLLLVSQNALPGSFFYPVKTGFENVILAAASVNPVTRAAFRTDLADRRLKEAQSLLLTEADISQLNPFIEEVKTSEEEISFITNVDQKKQLQAQLDEKISQYQQALTDTRQQLIAQNPSLAQQATAPSPPQAGQQSSQATQTQVNNTTVVQNIYYVLPTPTQSPNNPQVPTPTHNLSPTSQPPPPSGPTTCQSGNVVDSINCTIEVLNGLSSGGTVAPKLVSPPTLAPTSTPTPIPDLPTSTPVPTQTLRAHTDSDTQSSSSYCYDNPVNPPQGDTWKALCNIQCTQNSQCTQNTSDSSINPATSNWCYGFNGATHTSADWRCLQLQKK